MYAHCMQCDSFFAIGPVVRRAVVVHVPVPARLARHRPAGGPAHRTCVADTLGVVHSPTVRADLFQCSGCSWWSHVDCYPRYVDRDPVDLPLQMYCLKCRPLRASSLAEPSFAATDSLAAAPKRTSNDNAPVKEEQDSSAPQKKRRGKDEASPAVRKGRKVATQAQQASGTAATIVQPPSPLPNGAGVPIKAETLSTSGSPAPVAPVAPLPLVFAALAPSISPQLSAIPLPPELFDPSMGALPPGPGPAMYSFAMPYPPFDHAYIPAAAYLPPPMTFAAPPMSMSMSMPMPMPMPMPMQPHPYLQPPF